MNPKQLKDLDECVAMDAEGVSKDCNICSCRVCLSQETKLLYEARVGRAVLKGFAQPNSVFSIEPVANGTHYEIEITSPEELLTWAEEESEAESEPIV